MYRKVIVCLITIAVMFTMTFSTGLVYADDTVASGEPEGIPISTAAELLRLEDKTGKYYLANDIDLKEYPNCSISYFSGTLDGNGHTIYNYTVDDNFKGNGEYIFIGLFTDLDGEIKNLNMSDLNINLTLSQDGWYQIGTLARVIYNSNASLENIKISGNMNIVSVGTRDHLFLHGLVWDLGNFGKFENCTSDVNITCDVVSGEISGLYLAGMCSPFVNDGAEIKNCKNTGDIQVNISKDAKVELIKCGGLFNTIDEARYSLESCSNEGNISITNNGKKCRLVLSGIIDQAVSLSKCYNKGSLNVVGRFKDIDIGGLTAYDALKVSQSYNKGNISLELTAKPEENNVCISGLSGHVRKSISNSYNSGKITCTGKWNGGYVAGLIDTCDNECKITSNYHSGKITMPSGVKYGSIAREKNGVLKNNYFRRGTAFISGSAKSSQAKKVDAISKKNCSGLSSDYWTYSKSKKRMILKNNKEV